MWAYSRILFIHNNVWKLHVVSDIDLAVAIYISYDDRFIITLDNVFNFLFGVDRGKLWQTDEA